MEIIDKSDFIDVYVFKTLNEIKNVVRREIVLEKTREEETDRKMFLVLKDLINANFKNLQRDPEGNLIYTLLPIVDERENEKVRFSLELYYAALYYDNVSLLQDCLKEDVDFNRNYYKFFQYLDKNVSSKFEREDYIRKLKDFGQTFYRFNKSIEGLSDEERERYITRFVSLINSKNEDMLNYIRSKKSDGNLSTLFNKGNLDKFDDETYSCAKGEQLYFIDRLAGTTLGEDARVRLNNLIQTRGYCKHLRNFDLMMRLYTDDEIEKLEYDVSLFLDTFSENEEMLKKALDFVKLRSDLCFKCSFIPRGRFMEISNELLIEALDHMDRHYLVVNNHNLDILIRTMAPKTGIKKILGFYKRNS